MLHHDDHKFKKKPFITEGKKFSKSKEYLNTNTSLKTGKSKSKKKSVKETNRSKRLRTEPDSVNYMETIKLKMKKH